MLFNMSACIIFFFQSSSSPAFLTSLLTQSSHLSLGLPHLLLPCSRNSAALFGSLSSAILSTCPAHCNLLLTSLPVKLLCTPVSSLNSTILRLCALVTLAIFRTQLFSHICTLCCCNSVSAKVSVPYRHAGLTHMLMTLPFSLLEIRRSAITPSTALHAFAPAYALRRTSLSVFPSPHTAPPRYTKLSSWVSFFPSSSMSSICRLNGVSMSVMNTFFGLSKNVVMCYFLSLHVHFWQNTLYLLTLLTSLNIELFFTELFFVFFFIPCRRGFGTWPVLVSWRPQDCPSDVYWPVERTGHRRP